MSSYNNKNTTLKSNKVTTLRKSFLFASFLSQLAPEEDEAKKDFLFIFFILDIEFFLRSILIS